MENGQKPITPIPDLNEDESGLIRLTKREYFAGLAMQGLLSVNALYGSNNREYLVKDAIAYADELLKQLEK